MSEDYLDGVNFIDTQGEDLKYFKETFPENRDTVGQRAFHICRRFSHDDVPTFDEATAVVCVTHFAIEGNVNCKAAAFDHDHTH